MAKVAISIPDKVLEAIEKEREAIHSNLRKSKGLQRRIRKTHDPKDNARKRVQMNIARAKDDLRGSMPEFVKHLETFLTTGAECKYHPPPNTPPWNE